MSAPSPSKIPHRWLLLRPKGNRFLSHILFQGIWIGMLSGIILQTRVVLMMIYKTNWNREASLTKDRIRTWGGHQETTVNNKENTEEET